MKFLYEYRTSDNALHAGTVCAADREAAFAALRRQGVRPASLREAPGFLNKLFGKGKRWLAIGALAALAAGLAAALAHRPAAAPAPAAGAPAAPAYAAPDGTALPIGRRQIWGDEAVLEQATATAWRSLSDNPAERLLALFAQPGVLRPVFPELPATLADDVAAALSAPLRIAPDELDEYKQMKAIVEGMKEELRAYLAAGGAVDGYLRRLIRRQREEAAAVDGAARDLAARIAQGEDAFAAWQETNRFLREQGLRALPLPAL